MQNRTDLIGASLPERIRQAALRNEKWVRALLSLAAGYVMAGSRLFGGIAPFGVAFCASMQSGSSICAALGAVIGYLVSSARVSNMKYITAVILVAGLKWLLSAKEIAAQRRIAVCAGICFAALGVSSATVLILSGGTLYAVLLGTAELFLACGATYFFARSLDSLHVGFGGLSRTDFSCIIISFAIIITGFSSITIAGLSVGRMAAALIILLCALYGGEAGGAVSGITAGIALGLSGGDFSYVITAYGFGGLIAGVFGSMGRIAAAASFIVLNTAAALFTKEYSRVYTAIFEIFVSSVIFVAIPPTVAAKFRLLQMGQKKAAAGAGAQSALRDRMSDISTTLKEISTTTHQVSERLSRMESTGISGIYTQVADTVCKRCGRKSTCWQYQYNNTVAAMNDCAAQLKRSGSLTKTQSPKYLLENCCKLDEFLAEFGTRFRDYTAKEGVQLKVAKVRSVVTDQFEGMAMMVDEISREMCCMKLLDPKKAARVREYLEKEGIMVQQSLCFTDEYDRLTVELHIPNFQVAKLNRQKSALDLCALLEADLDLPQVTSREKYASVAYTEKAAFSVDFGAYQIPLGQNRLCGDAYDYIRNRGGRAHFVLSDGMGSGGSAAVDSSMASGLITRLLSVGVGHEAALKMVNSALLVKSGEESLATIDICSLDLFTGKTEFYKAGAAPTFVVKGGKAGYVESTSLPAGILRGVAFEKSSITLHEGDMVLLVSDGIVATGADWVKSELEALRGTDIQHLCEKLALTAKMRRTDGREDDITVMAMALRKGV